MPLKRGYGEMTLHQNIGKMIAEGHTRQQASAVSYKLARECYFARFPEGYLPPYLKLPNGARDKASWIKGGRK